MANLKEIQDFIKAVSRIGISEVDIQAEDIKLNVKFPVGDKDIVSAKEPFQFPQYQMPMISGMTQQMGNPVQAATTTTTPIEYRQDETKEEQKKYLTIKSPMVGTFYRRPSPDKPIYVNVGDEVQKGQVLCIIEAMKLFNEIESESAGKIVKILVEEGTPVEFDQPLFLIEP